MKKYSLLLALIASAGLVAAEDAPAKREGKKAPQDPAEAFKKMDKNADGKVSQEEFLAVKRWQDKQDQGKEVFAKADTDKDGNLTVEEFKAHVAKRGAKGPGGEGKGKGKGKKGGDKPAEQ